MLTVERLRAVLRYDPDTGEWERIKKGAGTRAKVGSRYGKGRRYIRISVDGKRYLAHRLAWFYMTGEWPYPETDHRDRDSLNNRWRNLREATRSENGLNRGKAKNNTSGAIGVRWSKHAKQWVAHVGRTYLGYFRSKEAAIEARAQALRSVAP